MKNHKQRLFRTAAAVNGLLLAATTCVSASENAPHAPFAQWADLPRKGELNVGLFYQESEAYHMWAGDTYYDVNEQSGGEDYGIDINQGYVTFQYGLTERWAADLAVGYTTAAWRHFSPDGSADSTTGLMDFAFGVRYQVWNEATESGNWKPTLTLRAGAVMPGSYDQDFAFAPGDRSACIEPEILMKKHFGWQGFGAYTDALFRWNRTTHNDHWMVSLGFFQEIKNWKLNAGYRHLGSVDGEDIVYNPATPETIDYPRAPREASDAIEAGFSYTTSKRKIELGFHTRTVVDGGNSDGKFWVGGYVNMPFQLIKSAK